MNLILLHPDDFIAPQKIRLSDYRFEHIRTVHKAQIGDNLRGGMLNGLCGTLTLLDYQPESVLLSFTEEAVPPAPLPVTLVMALPRPKMLKRSLQTISTMGVKKLYLINSVRVDKSFWSSPWLSEEKITEQLILGLEQAGDTLLPEVELRKRFKPFVEDELPSIIKGTRPLVAHPYQSQPCPAMSMEATTLAVGPEGGFIPYEIDKLQQIGFTSISLGARILRVETAVPALLSRLFPTLP